MVLMRLVIVGLGDDCYGSNQSLVCIANRRENVNDVSHGNRISGSWNNNPSGF